MQGACTRQSATHLLLERTPFEATMTYADSPQKQSYYNYYWNEMTVLLDASGLAFP